MVFDNWFMFPISIVMASCVGDATFFAPILLLGLGLPPEVVIGVGLITGCSGLRAI